MSEEKQVMIKIIYKSGTAATLSVKEKVFKDIQTAVIDDLIVKSPLFTIRGADISHLEAIG